MALTPRNFVPAGDPSKTRVDFGRHAVEGFVRTLKDVFPDFVRNGVTVTHGENWQPKQKGAPDAVQYPVCILKIGDWLPPRQVTWNITALQQWGHPLGFDKNRQHFRHAHVRPVELTCQLSYRSQNAREVLQFMRSWIENERRLTFSYTLSNYRVWCPVSTDPLQTEEEVFSGNQGEGEPLYGVTGPVYLQTYTGEVIANQKFTGVVTDAVLSLNAAELIAQFGEVKAMEIMNQQGARTRFTVPLENTDDKTPGDPGVPQAEEQ